MLLWNQIVDVLRESIFAYAQLFNGNVGAGILAVSFLARLALLPLGIHLARKRIAQQKLMAGASVLTGYLGGVVQAPAVLALYGGVKQAARAGGRFLWVRNVAAPDLMLAILATAVTVLATNAGTASVQNRTAMLALSAAIALVVLTKMSAGMALYWTMSSAFGSAQGWIARRQRRAQTA